MSELIQMMATNIDSMTLAEKLMGGTVVTVFAMGIVFIVLVLLMYVIKGMTKLIVNSENRSMGIVEKVETKEVETVKHTTLQVENSIQAEEEVVAAIIAAINANYSSSQSKIIIRNIVKNEQNNWASAGLLEQLNSRI